MRLALLALALLAAPLAGALPLPGACAEPCAIESSGFGYAPLATVIPSGGSVVWISSDVTHVTKSGAGVGDACVDVIHGVEDPSPAVRFDLVAGQLLATSEGETLVCTEAVVTPGAATLPYYCVLHPSMRGVLAVHAA